MKKADELQNFRGIIWLTSVKMGELEKYLSLILVKEKNIFEKNVEQETWIGDWNEVERNVVVLRSYIFIFNVESTNQNEKDKTWIFQTTGIEIKPEMFVKSIPA